MLTGLVWARLHQSVLDCQNLEEIGLTPRHLGLQMTVTLPKKDVELWMKEVVEGNWVQKLATIHWLKKPEEGAFMFMSGQVAIAQAGRYQLEDHKTMEATCIVRSTESNHPSRFAWIQFRLHHAPPCDLADPERSTENPSRKFRALLESPPNRFSEEDLAESCCHHVVTIHLRIVLLFREGLRHNTTRPKRRTKSVRSAGFLRETK
jgi:hypothetical protein